VFVPLEERTKMANRLGADVFLSIHVNSALRKSASGVETFFLSFDSTDEDARRLAAFENSSSVGPDGGQDRDDLIDIMLDLAQTAAHHLSSTLAGRIHESAATGAKGGDRGVKQAPFVVLTDVIVLPWVDLACDAAALPFRSGALGGMMMVDVLHHLAKPLLFLAEAARVLRPGGRIAAIEPWISPCSYVMYRWVHHERCRLNVDLACPFGDDSKGALEGNAAIPYKLLRGMKGLDLPLRVVEVDRFLALPYLVTFGFKLRRPLPGVAVRLAEMLERVANPVLRGLAATRVMVLLERVEGRSSASV
jgi:SAM-dependent methyltransferase